MDPARVGQARIGWRDRMQKFPRRWRPGWFTCRLPQCRRLGLHVAGEIVDGHGRHLADGHDPPPVLPERMHVHRAAAHGRFAALAAGHGLDVDRDAGQAIAVEKLHRIAKPPAGAQREAGRRRLHAPAGIGLFAGVQRLHAPQALLRRWPQVGRVGLAWPTWSFGEGHLLERLAWLADQARCAAAIRFPGRATGDSRSASHPSDCRSMIWQSRDATRPAFPSARLVAIEFAGVGELAGRIPATGGIGVVADRVDAGADAHHHLVVADHFAMRAGLRDQAHPLTAIIECVEDTERFHAGAGNHDQACPGNPARPGPGRCVRASRRRPCSTGPVTQPLAPSSQRDGADLLLGGKAPATQRQQQQEQERSGDSLLAGSCIRAWRFRSLSWVAAGIAGDHIHIGHEAAQAIIGQHLVVPHQIGFERRIGLGSDQLGSRPAALVAAIDKREIGRRLASTAASGWSWREASRLLLATKSASGRLASAPESPSPRGFAFHDPASPAQPGRRTKGWRSPGPAPVPAYWQRSPAGRTGRFRIRRGANSRASAATDAAIAQRTSGRRATRRPARRYRRRRPAPLTPGPSHRKGCPFMHGERQVHARPQFGAARRRARGDGAGSAPASRATRHP